MKRRFPHKERILLVNITRLGDMLQATPTLAGMKMENPDAKITVVVEKQFEDVCYLLPGIDEVVSIDLAMTVRNLAREQEGIIDAYEYVSELVDELRSRNFDYCLNMSSSGYTAMLLRLINVAKNGGWTADEEGYRVIESDWSKLFASSVFHQNRQYNSLNLVDVFRCSADVEQHPKNLIMNVPAEAQAYADNLIAEAGFTNTGPLVVLQAGASQGKRQWNTARFVALIRKLLDDMNARVVLSGSKKELAIIEPIKAAFHDRNVFVAAGKTSIAQLGGMLKASDILITGDTGPMHMAVAVGTPVISMFLASAFGFETGPYAENNIILQPVIGCGPCNPNKPCAGLECHDTIDPELVAWLAGQRLTSEKFEVPQHLADPNRVSVYRTEFDRHGFYDLKVINGERTGDQMRVFRNAYRKVWLDDLGGLEIESEKKPLLNARANALEGLDEVMVKAEQGIGLINQLTSLIRNPHGAGKDLAQINRTITETDRAIEQLGYHFGHLGPLTRMFIFAKENLCGTEPLDLASQMETVYRDIIRRGNKLAHYMA